MYNDDIRGKTKDKGKNMKRDLVLELPKCNVKVYLSVITEDDNWYYMYSAMHNDHLINCPDWGGHCRDFAPIYNWMKKTHIELLNA